MQRLSYSVGSGRSPWLLNQYFMIIFRSSWQCKAITLLFPLFALTGCRIADVGEHPRIVPMTNADLVGEWIGSTPGDVFIYRLVLQSNGQGVFGMSYSTNIQVYFVQRWKVDDGKIRAMLDKTDEYEDLSIDGTVAGAGLSLKIRGGSGWQHNVSMSRGFRTRLERLTTLMTESAHDQK